MATTEAARPAARYSQISAFRALPCPALVFAQACQSLTAYGSYAHWARAPSRPKLRPAVAPLGLSPSTGCPVSHSSLPVALLASHLPCGSLWAAPKAPLGPRFPSGQFASLTRREKALYCPFLKEGVRNVARRPVSEITHTFVRARAHSFPLSKRARLFPSAAYRRSAPPQLALGRLKEKPVRMLQ